MSSSANARDELAALVHGQCDALTRSAMTELLSAEVFKPRDGLAHTDRNQLTYDRLRHLGEQLPQAGKLLDSPQWLAALAAWTPAVDPSLFMAAAIHYFLCMYTLREFSAGRHDLTAPLQALETTATAGSFLVAELGRGTSQLALRTEAVYDAARHEFVLTTPDPAAQKFMPNTGLLTVPRVGIVCARLVVDGLDRGVFGFLVPLSDGARRTEGVHVRMLPASSAVPLDYAVTAFDHVRLPFANWLRDTASLTREGAFHDPIGGPDQRLLRTLTAVPTMWTFAAAALAAVSRVSAATALRHAARRTTMGRLRPGATVLDYRNQQWSLIGALATAYALTFLANGIIEDWTDRRSERGASRETDAAPSFGPVAPTARTASLVKVLATWEAERVAAECRLSAGAQGVLSANRFVEYQGLAQGFQVAGGDNTLIVLDAARAMLAGEGYQPPGDDGEGDLRQPSRWRSLMSARERHLHEALATGIAASRAADRNEFDTWNEQLRAAQAFVRAHCRRLAVATFIDTVEAAPAAARSALEPLCAVYALREIVEDVDWYQRHGLLTATEADGLVDDIQRLFDRVIADLPVLLDAFEIPEGLTEAPVAADYLTRLSPPDAWAGR
jgi:acyl-CoA oxidase